MKWFLCALCCLTEGLSVLRAQIMPDSSVQICAYWTPGDKYAYEAREEKFKIDDQGDTTLVYRQSERRVFEILSQTKDRYKIRLTYGDYMTTDKEDQLVHDAIVSATGPCVVEFETDETGSLLGIANLETLVAQAEASVEPAVRVMWETIPSAERKNFPKKNFRKYMGPYPFRSIGRDQCRERRFGAHVLFPWGTARFDAGIRIRRDVRSAVGWPGFCAGKDFVLD